jgi:hypothetical protein
MEKIVTLLKYGEYEIYVGINLKNIGKEVNLS